MGTLVFVALVYCLLIGCASMTDLIRSKLHWLSFPERVTYELCVLSYKCLYGTAPEYLSRHFVPTSTVPGRTRLRSAAAGLLVVPYVPSRTIGSNRSFAYWAPVPGINCTNCHLASVTRPCHWQVSKITLKPFCLSIMMSCCIQLGHSVTIFTVSGTDLRWHSLHSPLWCNMKWRVTKVC